MFHFLERLQARPERERVAITIATAGGVTALVFVAWVVAVGARIADSTPAPATDAAPTARLSDLVRDVGTFAPSENAAGAAAAPAIGAPVVIEEPVSIEQVAPAEPIKVEPAAPPEEAVFVPSPAVDSPVRIDPVGEYQIR